MNVEGRRCIHPGFRPFIFGAPKSCLVLVEKRLSSIFPAPLASFLEQWVPSLPQPRFATANGKQIGMQEFVTSVDHVPLFHLFHCSSQATCYYGTEYRDTRIVPGVNVQTFPFTLTYL